MVIVIDMQASSGITDSCLYKSWPPCRGMVGPKWGNKLLHGNIPGYWGKKLLKSFSREQHWAKMSHINMQASSGSADST